ncbi:hypothetical protein [Nocardioides rubriscoriae]|uniref:hypothetical protein n=1 Tax=Nocardioides rubriscoriae TaxID=642762 RepID=UPI0011E002B4|nr:hypothetical protein [Nocardioides rubriscoriae]
MSRILGPAARGNLSLVLSALALLVAMSGTAYAVANGSIRTKALANGAVTTPKIKNGAVTTPKLKRGAVTSPKLGRNAVTGAAVKDGSLRLADLGGSQTAQVTVLSSPITIPAGECDQIFLTLYNPAPDGVLGSLVVGTVTSATGGAVVNNTGTILPTLVTETSQGGAIPYLMVCAGGSSQTVPANSIVTWSLIAP